MHFVKPDLCSVLADRDRSMIHNGDPTWSAEYALDGMRFRGIPLSALEAERDRLMSAMGSAPEQWTLDRLTALGMMFSMGRTAPAPKVLAVWLAETTRLICDLPHDVLAHSIDVAVKASQHGFMPSVGEIRAIADPLVDLRKTQLERLRRMEAALADQDATARREQRWRDLDRAELERQGKFDGTIRRPALNIVS